MKRRFIDAHPDVRCVASIVLSDKSRAQCGRRRTEGSDRCWQHTRRSAKGGSK